MKSLVDGVVALVIDIKVKCLRASSKKHPDDAQHPPQPMKIYGCLGLEALAQNISTDSAMRPCTCKSLTWFFIQCIVKIQGCRRPFLAASGLGTMAIWSLQWGQVSGLLPSNYHCTSKISSTAGGQKFQKLFAYRKVANLAWPLRGALCPLPVTSDALVALSPFSAWGQSSLRQLSFSFFVFFLRGESNQPPGVAEPLWDLKFIPPPPAPYGPPFLGACANVRVSFFWVFFLFWFSFSFSFSLDF